MIGHAKKFITKGKKIGAAVLAGAVVIASLNVYAVYAEEADIVVNPFDGQEFYYGQTKTFLKDEHYSLSREPEEGTEITWRLEPEKNEVGEQKFCLTGNAAGFGLAKDAPTVKIKNLSISEKAEDIAAVNKAYMEDESNQTVRIPAPAEYLIADSVSLDAGWDTGLEIDKNRLQEGDNAITYYLRSNKDDNTRKAIDVNPKNIVVTKDSIPPVITTLSANAGTDTTGEMSITSSEVGTYYYLVVSENYFGNSGEGDQAITGMTADEVRKKVESNEGITGSGRIDKDKQVNISIQNLKPETDYMIYALLVDKAGNASDVKQVVFSTDKTSLAGQVAVTGDVAVDATLTAAVSLTTVDPGNVTYQWYRVKVDADTEEFETAYDETGGAAKDDLEADYDADEEDDEEDEDEEEDENEDDGEDEDEIETEALKKMAVDSDEISLGSGTPISGATSSTYKITKEDIGYRLLVEVSTSNSSQNITGVTNTFVPKLMPSYTMPKIAKSAYLPTRRLSAVKLPGQWSWVDSTIVPVYGNSGYRARFVPADTKVYKTVIVRVKVPVSKRTLKKSMVKVPKTSTYAGKAIKDNFTVKDQKKKLGSRKDYKATYKNNKKLGTATVWLQGKGNYKGNVKFTYKIVKKSVKNLSSLYDKELTYNGKRRIPDLVLKNTSVKLKEKVDYTIEYKDNIQVGKATAVIRGIGNYKGKKIIHFNIIPRKPVISKAAGKKGSIRLTLSGNTETKGYYVYVSTAKTFAKKKTWQYSTTGNNFGIQGMVKGTYYVQVTAYASARGKVYTSSYSKVKKIKVK